MGFYIRKAVSVGPFRFNLSQSGIGVSAGVRGLRVGAGPRGNYVHMGRGGLYFRQTLSPAEARQPRDAGMAPARSGAVGDFEEIDSTDAVAMTDIPSASLLAELNFKRNIRRMAPLVLITSAALLISLDALGAHLWLIAAVCAVCFGSWLLARSRDTLKKTTVVVYDLDPEASQRFEAIHGAFMQAASCGGRWHIGALGSVKDGKYHGGAGNVVRRAAIDIRAGQPPDVKCNVDPPLLPVGAQTLAFMPDRLLVFDDKGVGAVGYAELSFQRAVTRFVESETVPSDARVVGQTWQYVNKCGGPDRRFKDNRELPICAYEEIRFTSSSGLYEVIQLSSEGPGLAIVEALSATVRSTTSEEAR